MRLRAISLCLFFAAYGVDASPFQQQQQQQLPGSKSPWGIVAYGGDSTPPLPLLDDNAITHDNDNSDRINNEKYTTSSQQLLNSVSAGGGSPSDHEMAFVRSSTPTTTLAGTQASTATSVMASTTMLKKPSLLGTNSEMNSSLVVESSSSLPSSSSSSLSVASNKQKDMEAILSSSRQEVETMEMDGQSDKNQQQQSQQQQQQKRPLKILFLSSDTGGGHRASAEALAAQFQRLFPGSTYDLFDVWTDVESSWPYYTIKDTYKSFSATPWKWRALYHVSNNAVYAKLADLHSYYMNEDLITEKMEEYNPDVVGKKIDMDMDVQFGMHVCVASMCIDSLLVLWN